MSEGSPQKPATRNESAPRPPVYQVLERVILETKLFEDGSKDVTEQIFECNGTLHRRCVDAVSYDAKGNLTFADQLSKEELGACDGNHP